MEIPRKPGFEHLHTEIHVQARSEVKYGSGDKSRKCTELSFLHATFRIDLLYNLNVPSTIKLFLTVAELCFGNGKLKLSLSLPPHADFHHFDKLSLSLSLQSPHTPTFIILITSQLISFFRSAPCLFCDAF